MTHSTAHRTDPDWDYGFAELSKAHREAIKNSKRVANPGCHASGFISSVYPLVANGIIAEDTALTLCFTDRLLRRRQEDDRGVQDENRDPRHDSERIYGLNLHHKHRRRGLHLRSDAGAGASFRSLATSTRAWRLPLCSRA